MTKKKSTLLQVLFLLAACGVLIVVLLLTGCGPSREAVSDEFNGDDYFVTSDVANLTNQEAYELMIQSPDAIFILLNMVDAVLLREQFDIPQSQIDDIWGEFEAEMPDVEGWLAQSGFESVDQVKEAIELQELREALVADMTSDDMTPGGDVLLEALVNLRYEANLEILNEELAADYEAFLSMMDIEIDVLGSDVSNDVVATADGVEITVGAFFNELTRNIGLETILDEIDNLILRQTYTVDAADVYERIEGYRVDLGDEFEDILESAGMTEASLFEFLESQLIVEALMEERMALTEEQLRQIYDEIANQHELENARLMADADVFTAGYHILVEDEDFANELIKQLVDVAEDEFLDLFSELAATYSQCPSGERSGGNLGTWDLGQMVEPFDTAIFGLDKGDFTTEPVETEFGFHIIYRPSLAEIPAFEDVREDIEAGERARMQQTPGFVEGIFTELRQDVNIIFTDPRLQAVMDEISAVFVP